MDEVEVTERADVQLPRWSSLRCLWLNLAALGLVLLGGVWVINNGNIAVPDEGVYAAQVDLVSHGSWDAIRPGAKFDHEGTRTVVRADFVDRDRYVPYPRHPAFTILMEPFYKVGGFGGMLVASALGTWAAALASSLLARRLNPVYGIPALWITGIGCPLFFDAYLVGGHSIAAALFGFAVLGLTQALDDRRYWSLLFALPAGALLVNVRSEGVVAMGAVAGVVGLLALSGVFVRRVDWRSGLIAVSVLVVSGAAYVVDAWLTRVVMGSGAFGGQPLQRVLGKDTGPGRAAWASLLRPSSNNTPNANTALILAITSLLLAAVVIKVMPKQQLLAVGLTLLAAGAAIGQLFAAPDLISGLYSAFPLLPAGILLLGWVDLKSALPRRLLGIGVVTTVLLLLTIYDVGGAVEWGGRFFHLLLPTLVPLVVLGLDNGRRRLSFQAAWIVGAAVMIVSIAITFTGVRVNYVARRVHRQAVDSTMSFARAHSTTKKPLVIVAMLNQNGTGRMFWHELGGADLLSSNGIQDMLELVGRAKAAGYRSVTAISNAPRELLEAASSRTLTRIDWKVNQAEMAGRSGYVIYEFTPN